MFVLELTEEERKTLRCAVVRHHSDVRRDLRQAKDAHDEFGIALYGEELKKLEELKAKLEA